MNLAELKEVRGNHCLECGIDISDPSQKDHSFCNYCWWNMLKHTFTDYGTGICDLCTEDDANGELHQSTFTGIDVEGAVRS